MTIPSDPSTTKKPEKAATTLDKSALTTIQTQLTAYNVYNHNKLSKLKTKENVINLEGNQPTETDANNTLYYSRNFAGILVTVKSRNIKKSIA